MQSTEKNLQLGTKFRALSGITVGKDLVHRSRNRLLFEVLDLAIAARLALDRHDLAVDASTTPSVIPCIQDVRIFDNLSLSVRASFFIGSSFVWMTSCYQC